MSDEKRPAALTTANGDVEVTLPRGEQPENETDDYEGYLSGFKLYLIVFGLCISVLLVALVCTPNHDISEQRPRH
jgi:hypothetical protein